MFDGELYFLKLLESLRNDFLNNFFEFLTFLGEETIVVLLIAILFFAFNKDIAYRLFFVSVTSLGLNNIIKNFVKMPRPFSSGQVSCVRPETATGYSFPSGHTQSFASWSFSLAILLKKLRYAVISIILILLVALSRMYLGAHYPSDVVVGAFLGILSAILLNKIYDKVHNKLLLYLLSVIVLSPFAILFLIYNDPMYADFYKIYGMLWGFLCSYAFEKHFVSMRYDVPWWKKSLRIIISVAIVLIIKEITNVKLFPQFSRICLIIDILRYFIVVFTGFGLCPLLFKKINL